MIYFDQSAQQRLIEKLYNHTEVAARSDVSHFKGMGRSSKIKKFIARPSALDVTTDKVIAIGASAGGIEAIARIIPLLPATIPGIVIAQYMPPAFTKTYA